MSIVSRLSRKNIKKNKSWSIFTVMGIILATAMITAVVAICFSFYQMVVDNAIRQSGTHQVMIREINNDGLAYIMAREDIDVVIQSEIVKYAESKYQYQDELTGLLVDNSYVATISNINPLVDKSLSLKQGRMPENSSELVISQYELENYSIDYPDVKVNDKIRLKVSEKVENHDVYDGDRREVESSLVDGYEKEYTLVGILDNYPYSSLFGSNLSRYELYTSSDTPISNTVVFDYKKISSSLLSDADKIFQTYKTDRSTIHFNNSYLEVLGITNNNYRLNLMRSVGTVGLIVISLILVAGVSLIRNSFEMAATQRVKQLGMLSSVGATKHQKKWILYHEGLYLSIIGIILGIFAGYLGMWTTFTILNMNNELFREMGLRVYIPWYGIVTIIIFALIMVYFSMQKPARMASKVSPIESIRENKTYRVSKKKYKSSSITQRILGFEGEVAHKYMVRNKSKYRPTLISLTISIVLFLVALNITGMMRQTISLNDRNNSDIIVYGGNYSDKQDELASKLRDSGYFKEVVLLNLLENTTSIDQSQWKVDFSVYGEHLENQNVSLVVLDDKSFQKLLSVNGVSNDSLYVFNDQYMFIDEGKALAGNKTSLAADDKIKLISITPDHQIQELEITLNARVNQLLDGVLSTSRPDYRISVYTNFTEFSRIKDQQPHFDYNGVEISLKLNKVSDSEKAEKFLKNEVDGLLNGSHVYNAIENYRKSEQMITIVTVFVTGFISLITLICVVNIINTMSNNIRSRRKEFAILKSVGMDRKGINKMLYYEAIMYGVKAILYSVPLSAIINYFAHQQMLKSITLDYGIGPIHYVVVILIVMSIVLLTMLYVSRNIKRQNIIETIKDESL